LRGVKREIKGEVPVGEVVARKAVGQKRNAHS